MSANGVSHTQSLSEASLADTVVPSDSPTGSKFSPTLSPQASTFKPPPLLPASSLIPPASIQDVVPPEHPFRTLVVCFDGTGDQFDSDNSNIVGLFSMLKKDDRTKQMVYYQAGIGTYTTPQIATPMASKISKTLDEMFAWNLDTHVMGGYEFLMQNYTAGDRICIFGFSRGAYTARALAGMIHKVGLLPACNHQQVPFAYKMFSRADELGWKQSVAFKKCFSNDVDIEFIGVWDTVNSVGLFPRRLPFTTSNTAVRTFRHAVALDERRAKFKANLWNRPNDKEAKLGEAGKPKPQKKKSSGGSTPTDPEAAKKFRLRQLEKMYEKPKDTPTDIEEVWFSGCHCDIGGGSVDNDTRHNLARIPLRWMIRECFKTKTGIMFDAASLREIGLDPARLYPEVLPRPRPLPVGSARIACIPKASTSAPTPAPEAALVHYAYPDGEDQHSHSPTMCVEGMEEIEELHDAMCPIYDQLSLAKWWWFLEFLPMKQRYQRSNNKWESTFGWNLGRPRIIPKQLKRGFKVHRSVKMRMEAEHEDQPGVKYKPRPLFQCDPIWVD